MESTSSQSPIARLRVILDTEQEVYRDIEIDADSTLFHLHNAILDAFSWSAGEMASFFESDKNWDRGREFSLMEIGGEGDMTLASISLIFKDLDSRAVYVYDFLRMWCFNVETLAFIERSEDVEYPRLCSEKGTPPLFDCNDKDLLFGMDLELPDDLKAELEAAAAEEAAAAVAVTAEDEEKGPIKTGDPEIDAYLANQESDEDEISGWNEDHASLDDLDGLI